MPTIELDYASDTLPAMGAPDEQALTDRDIRTWLDEEGYGEVTFEVVQLHGPAGGNPVVRFTVPDERLRAFVQTYDGGNGEVDYLLESSVVA